MGSRDRQREAWRDSVAFESSAFDALDVDSCSSDKADSKLCSVKKLLSSSDGDEYSKLLMSKRSRGKKEKHAT